MATLQVQDPVDKKLFQAQPFITMSPNHQQESTQTLNNLLGSTIISPILLRDIDDSMGGFFIFHDLGIITPGHYRLSCHLMNIKW